jgi:TRAP-type C4-dicarboxylate transport system permease small subunit
MVSQAVFTFIGMGMLVYSEDHITIEVHKLIKNVRVLAMVETIMYLLLIAFSVLYIYLGADLMAFALQTGTATTQLRIPLALPYGAMLAGFACVIIHAVGKLMRLFVMRGDLESIFNKEADIEEMR